MNNFLQVFFVFFSALLVALSIPNEFFLLGSPYIALFALMPLYFAMYFCPSYKKAGILMSIHTGLVHLFSSFWLAFFKDFAIFTLGASCIGTAFVGSFFGVFLHFSFKKDSLRISHFDDISLIPKRIFYFTAVYILYEWTKSSVLGFLAYPWGTLSSAAFRFRLLMQIADITGAYGVSFLFALCSSTLAQGILLVLNPPYQNAKNHFASYKNVVNTFVVLLALSFCYGAYQYSKPRLAQKNLNTVLVQQNANPWDSASDIESIECSQKLTEEKIKTFTEKGETCDLVVWSEGVLRYAFPDAENHYRYHPEEESLCDFIERMNVPFIIGGAYLVKRNPSRYINSALLFDNEGNFRAANGKIHLVPFAEIMPGMEFPFLQKILERIAGISAGWIAGNRFVYFDIPCTWHKEKQNDVLKIVSLENTKDEQRAEENKKPLVRISTPICFEDAFPSDVCRPLFLNGSEVFINLTDDSWSRTKSAEYQHFAIAAYRAIEYRTTLVRSTNAGVSAVLDPTAKVLASLPLFKEDALAFSVPVYKRCITTYALFGDWFTLVLFIFALYYAFLHYVFARANLNSSIFDNLKRVLTRKI